LRVSAFIRDEKNSNDTKLGETKQRLVTSDESIDKVSPSEGELEPFYEEALVNTQESSLAEPELLNIEAFTDIYEQSLPKCPGCGAVFQSEDPEKSGYVIPSKNPLVEHQTQGNDLTFRTLVCQKCFNLKHYNKPFAITTTSREVMEYLSHLQRRKGLILYVVDLLDLPGSLFTNLLEIVGEAKRIIIVGNKVDMLPVDGHTVKQEEHLQKTLFTICKGHGLEGANVKSTCLVSAKTGFGMLQLASKILEHWDHKGDVYLIGCSNTGKTSLFNLLLDLFSVYKKGDLLQRATVSLWPCTTQKLLRFSISHWMLKKLCTRLREGVEKSDNPEIEIDDEIIDKEETDYKERRYSRRGKRRNALVPLQSDNRSSSLAILKPSFVTDQPNKSQTWLYDTPGIINKKQITNLLTMEELKLLNPALWIVPRTFILKPGHSLLIGGLGRVDYLEIKRQKRNRTNEWDTIPKAVESIFFTVMTSTNLPVHICKEEKADQVYETHAGTQLLGVPCGGKERMETFPRLKSQDFTVKGVGWDTSAADVVLSNIGWVSVTAGSGSLVSLKAHTPNGIGLDIREPALLPTSVNKRGRRGVRYQGFPGAERYEATRKKNPQFISMARGQHGGELKWMQEIKRKRKEQRLLLKFERRSQAADRHLLQRSAASSPPEIPGAFGLPFSRGKLNQEGRK